ncbi:hypothetical protein JMUB6875_60420 [Nocardia sp. JMUB6875]|uniref:hypothetical protein n=1 Tax=Nocardia sp. JMUB6875 TaxID=3158170 RepID=UPI0032E6BAE7
MRTVRVESVLPANVDQVWSAMLSPATFAYVCRGLFAVPAVAGRIEPLRAGDRGTGWLFAFHVLPAYRHTIEVIEVDAPTRTIRTRERGGVLRSWDHTLHAEPIDENTCTYSDSVDIDAGVLTPAVARIATAIYRYRHRRWQKLVHTEEFSTLA